MIILKSAQLTRQILSLPGPRAEESHIQTPEARGEGSRQRLHLYFLYYQKNINKQGFPPQTQEGGTFLCSEGLKL